MDIRALLRSVGRYYQSTAVHILNVLLFFVFINLAMAGSFGLIDIVVGPANPIEHRYGAEHLPDVYGDMKMAQIRQLLHECWHRPLSYEPFTGLAEAPYQGDYVNVSEHGWRKTLNQGQWPLSPDALNIFVFGGSTTFGYGVADWQTIPSFLHKHLAKTLDGQEVRVYNFGRGYYYSTQERVLFFQLLANGIVPDAVVFIDGINDFYFHSGSHQLASSIGGSFEGSNVFLWSSAVKKLPVYQAARSFRNTLKSYWAQDQAARARQIEMELEGDHFKDEDLMGRVITRYLANKRLIQAAASDFGIAAVFVWQPHPAYRYDLNSHLFLEGSFARHGYAREGYTVFARRLEKEPLRDDFIWCADIQYGLSEALYVDQVHYSPAFSDYFAEQIARAILERGLFARQIAGP